MGLLARTDLLTYSLVITLLLIIYIIKNYNFSEISINIFLYILFSTSAVIILEELSLLFNGQNTPFAKFMNYFSNSVLSVFETLPGFFWILYIDYKVKGNLQGLKKRLKFYLIPVFFVIIIVLLSLKTGVLFKVDTGNIYKRGLGEYFCAGVTVIQYVIAFRIAIYNRKNFDSDLIITIASFFILPLFGMFIQLQFYGATLIWPLFSLVNLIAFIILEKDVLLRDPLTGIYTRGIFEQKVVSYLLRGISFNLIMFDLDKFKNINDTFGHKVGDSALIEVVKLVQREIRNTDLFCRYGGDEFIILLRSDTEHTGIISVARIYEILNKRNSVSGVLYKLEMSIGHMFVPKNCKLEINEILEEVDKKMYLEKAKKENGYSN